MEQSALLSQHTRHNRFFALLVALGSLITYLLTVAPSVSFWDCGEYIGSAYSMGIPHPPGNPLYVLLGRFFTIILPFFNEVAFRVNLISVISGALTAMLMYLVVVRITLGWMGLPDTLWKRCVVYLGGCVGGFYVAFGSTFWFSAVESSVYIPAMLVVALGVWLSLVWAQSVSPDRDRLLLLIAYLCFLGIGVHMMAMMAMLPIFVFIVLWDRSKLNDWRLWVTVFLLGSVIYQVSAFLWMGPVTVAITFIMSTVEGPHKRRWRFCFWIALFALLGYSVHAYIPIRSALKPIIDENHPADWEAFLGFLERRQYGSENMFMRMFHRRGALATQFGIDAHMGFGGFHLTQFMKFSQLDTVRSLFADGLGQGYLKLLLYLTPTFLMLFGWSELYKKNKSMAIFLIFLVVATTIGLVFFMNFADGTRAELRDYRIWTQRGRQGPMPTVHREVRIRDYFFTAGFMFYGMWIGIAASLLMHRLFTSAREVLRTTVAPVVVVLFAVSPALPLVQNFTANNRTGDWIPYDYAYNLLMSCDKDGILFTNGDNDTFPLWFLQEAMGIRKDVRVVNLSLLNTLWYIRQLKELDPQVPISYSWEEIDVLNHELNPFEKDTPIRTPLSGIRLTVPGRERQHALRVQDKMVLNIVDANRWRKPIYFAVTVSHDNKMGLDPYLRMEGLVYRVMPAVLDARERVDLDRTIYLLDNVYRYRGLGDGTLSHLNETTHKLLSNYAAGYIQVALSMRDSLSRSQARVDALQKQTFDTTLTVALRDSLAAQLGALRVRYETDLEMVIVKLHQCVGLMPWDWRPRTLRHQFLIAHGRHDEAQMRMREALLVNPDHSDYLKMLAQALEEGGKQGEAAAVLRQALDAADDPEPWYTHLTLAQHFIESGLPESALAVMERFSDRNPNDQRARQYVEQFRRIQGEQPPVALPQGSDE